MERRLQLIVLALAIGITGCSNSFRIVREYTVRPARPKNAPLFLVDSFYHERFFGSAGKLSCIHALPEESIPLAEVEIKAKNVAGIYQKLRHVANLKGADLVVLREEFTLRVKETTRLVDGGGRYIFGDYVPGPTRVKHDAVYEYNQIAELRRLRDRVEFAHVILDSLSTTQDHASYVERCRTIALQPPQGWVFAEAHLNALGYKQLHRGDADLAEATMKLNCAFFPRSANVYDSLSECYAETGQRQAAEAAFVESFRLFGEGKACEEQRSYLENALGSQFQRADWRLRVLADDAPVNEVRQLCRLLLKSRNILMPRYHLGEIVEGYGEQGQMKKAAEVAELMTIVWPESVEPLLCLSYAYAKADMRNEAVEVLEAARALAFHHGIRLNSYRFARVHFALGLSTDRMIRKS